MKIICNVVFQISLKISISDFLQDLIVYKQNHVFCETCVQWLNSLFDVCIDRLDPKPSSSKLIVFALEMSVLSVISEGERRFICGGIDVNLRSDGRSCDDYQLITVERDVTHNCDGSAHVRSGHNDILVGIKLEIKEVEQLDEWDECGSVDFSADITANASPMFEGRQGEDISDLLVVMFTEAIPQCLDLKSLVVVPNRFFWIIHVDIVVLECGSLPSLIDSAAIAVKSALFDTK